MAHKKLIKEDIAKNVDLILRIREQFLTRVEYNDELYDEEDVRKVKCSDWHIWRFLRPVGYNEETALERLDRAMKWRKEININNSEDCDAPKEFYEAGGIFALNYDKNGSHVIYMRVKVNLKIPKIIDFVKQFIVFTIDRVDRKANDSGFVLVFDMSNAGVRNADMDLLSFIVSILRAYFPEGMQYCIVYNLPWILRYLWPVVKMWLSSRQQKMVKFANGNEIKEYIDEQYLPKYLGGLCTQNFAVSPMGCKSVTEMAVEYGFTDDEVQRYLEIFEPNIKETKSLIL